MNFKRLGNLGIAFTVALLALNLYLNREHNLKPMGTGPAGFPWPTDGLGQVTVGMEGSFRIELEERVPGETATERVPKMTIVGIDPGPEDGGMSFRQALVTSLAVASPVQSSSEQAQIVARAPRAWAAILSDEDGTRFDRTQHWRMYDPVVTFPALAGGQEFVLTTDLALLDPISNEVHCPGPFRLTSTGLELNGTGLRLDPQTGVIHFGEEDGQLDWIIASGKTEFRGATDGGGSFRPLDETTHELHLNAIEQCWMKVPLANGASGRLEAGGLRVLLRNDNDKWLPQSLAGDGRTFWTSPLHSFSGGPVDGNWDAKQQLQGLLVDGPLVGQSFDTAPEQSSGWLTSVGGGWIDPQSGKVDLWDRVTVDHGEGRVQSQRVAVGPGQRLLAEGDPFLLSQHGMVFAEQLMTIDKSSDLTATGVTAFPAGNKIDVMRSQLVVLSENGMIHSPVGFEMSGSRDGQDWQLRGNDLEASTGKVPILAQATGAVEWKLDNGRILGELVELLDNGQISARGKPMLAAFPVEGGSAIGSADSCFLSEDMLHLTGNPNVDFPALALGLAGSRCLIAADLVHRLADGSWSFLGNVVFTGSCQGTAQKVFLHADGGMEMFRLVHDKPFEATLRDGRTVIASAGWMYLHGDGRLELKEDLDLTLKTVDSGSQRMTGKYGELSRDDGWVTGSTQIWTHDLHAKANRLWWETDEFGKTLLHLEGHAEFAHPKGNGRAHKLDLDPITQEIEMHRSKRRKAWLKLVDGRVIDADWIRLDPVRMLLSSRQGSVTKVPPIQ